MFALDRGVLAPNTLGLRQDEAQDLLVAVQDTVVAHQVTAAVAAQVPCPHLGGHVGIRTPGRSWCATCSACYVCPVPAGGTATATTTPAERSSPWLSCCPSGPLEAGLPAGPLRWAGLLRAHRDTAR